MENPFRSTGYVSPENFCDRKEETNAIINALNNGRNLTLFSIRRMGKTGLIHHVLHKLKKKKVQCFLFDIYATQNTQDLINLMGSEIMGSADSFPVRAAKTLKDIVLSFRPRISYDALTGAPSVDFHLQQDEPENTLKQLLDYLEKQGKQVIIAIDEFQQINNYPETNLEALLRTQIQHLKNVRFIFSGSETHLLLSMFNDVSRPFYQSTQLLHLQHIAPEIYKAFIENWMKKGGKKINLDALEQIMKLTRIHTYYVQMLCNRLFSSGVKKIDVQTVNNELSKILLENEYVYFNYRNMLSANQWKLLGAIAKESVVRNPNSKDFLQMHQLGAASSTSRTLKALIDKDMVGHQLDEKGSLYRVNDVFFEKWLQRL